MTTTLLDVHEAAPPAPARYSWQRGLPRTASTRRRAVAFSIDTVVVFLLAWTLTLATATTEFLRIPDVEFATSRNPVLGLLYMVSIFELPILLLYCTAFEATIGRTPGKMLARVRVARADGAKASLGDAFLRNLLRLLWVTPLGPAFILLDAWALRATELDQRLGDLAASTVVVEDGR